MLGCSRLARVVVCAWRVGYCHQQRLAGELMADERELAPVTRHYFVDEAGDATLFSRRGKVIVGEEGCSMYFVLGLLDIADPNSVGHELTALRRRLLDDPYFQGVSSMQPAARKAATAFHAKDDLPEVRREVYALLMQHEMKFFALIRDKRRIARLVLERQEAHLPIPSQSALRSLR